MKRILAILLASVLPSFALSQGVAPRYHVVGQISGPDGLWDYASIDTVSDRLFIGKKGGLAVLDLSIPDAVPAMLFKSPVVHQALPVGAGLVLGTGGVSDAAFLLDGRDGRLLARIATGKDTDAAAFDGKTHRAITFNRGDATATIIDLRSARAVVTIHLPSRAEFAVGDGNGHVYVNLTNEIAVVDVAQARIAQEWALGDCAEPTGLALDLQSHALISACANGIAAVTSTDGHRIATLKIGSGADAVFIDQQRRMAFVPNGDDGTLTVISLADPQNPQVVQTLKTQIEARTGAVDPKTGRIYLPVGALLPPQNGEKWPSVVPGTFQIITIDP